MCIEVKPYLVRNASSMLSLLLCYRMAVKVNREDSKKCELKSSAGVPLGEFKAAMLWRRGIVLRISKSGNALDCSFALLVLNKQRDTSFETIILNSLDCWSFKTFNHGLNHSKIYTARQFVTFSVFFFFFFGNGVWLWLSLHKRALLENELFSYKRSKLP